MNIKWIDKNEADKSDGFIYATKTYFTFLGALEGQFHIENICSIFSIFDDNNQFEICFVNEDEFKTNYQKIRSNLNRLTEPYISGKPLFRDTSGKDYYASETEYEHLLYAIHSMIIDKVDEIISNMEELYATEEN